jgi:hypothetical protein
VDVDSLPPLLALFPRLGLLVRIPEGVQEKEKKKEEGGGEAENASTSVAKMCFES